MDNEVEDVKYKISELKKDLQRLETRKKIDDMWDKEFSGFYKYGVFGTLQGLENQTRKRNLEPGEEDRLICPEGCTIDHTNDKTINTF